MLLLPLALSLLSAAPKRGAPPPAADAVSPVELLGSREKEVKWKPGTVLRTDLTLDGVPDAVVLGTDADAAYVALVAGPLSSTSKHWVVRFVRPNLGSPDSALCGEPEKASIRLERLTPPVETSGCDVPDPGADCEPLLALAKALTDASKKGSQGVSLRPGPCDNFHLYFDPATSKFEFWRL